MRRKPRIVKGAAPAIAPSEQRSDECSRHNTILRRRCPRVSKISCDSSKDAERRRAPRASTRDPPWRRPGLRSRSRNWHPMTRYSFRKTDQRSPRMSDPREFERDPNLSRIAMSATTGSKQQFRLDHRRGHRRRAAGLGRLQLPRHASDLLQSSRDHVGSGDAGSRPQHAAGDPGRSAPRPSTRQRRSAATAAVGFGLSARSQARPGSKLGRARQLNCAERAFAASNIFPIDTIGDEPRSAQPRYFPAGPPA